MVPAWQHNGLPIVFVKFAEIDLNHRLRWIELLRNIFGNIIIRIQKIWNNDDVIAYIVVWVIPTHVDSR